MAWGLRLLGTMSYLKAALQGRPEGELETEREYLARLGLLMAVVCLTKDLTY